MVSKKYRIQYRKNLVSEKVSDSVFKKIGIGKSLGFSFVQILGILVDVSISKLLGFKMFPFFRWFWIRYQTNLVLEIISDSVKKKFGVGYGIGKSWYPKKFRIRFHSDFGYRYTLLRAVHRTPATQISDTTQLKQFNETHTTET